MSIVPDLVRLETIPVNYLQNIETDLIETSTFQEATAQVPGFARFDLQRKGFLHSHSKLFIGLVPPAGNNAYLPLNIGISSVIERAVLKVGNQVLNEISDFQFFHMLKSIGVDNENQVEREYYTTGRVINNKFIHRVADGTQSAPTSQAPTYGLDNGREYSKDGADQEGADLLSMPFATMDSTVPAQSPVYSIDLSDLFPFLKTHSLPLYMIDEPLYIELHWSNLRSRVCNRAADAGLGGSYTIDRNELKFCADYIFYTDGDAMERYAMANPTLEFTFPDYRLSKSTLTDVQLGTAQVRNVGMANRLVSRVMTQINKEVAVADFAGTIQASILSKYTANVNTKVAPGTNTNNQALSYNVRYNDKFEFPTSITNVSRLFTHFTQSETIPFVSRQMYSNSQLGLTGFAFEGNTQSTKLSGNFFHFGTRLTNSRVGVRGIEIHLQLVGMTAGTYAVRSYMEYMRVARLSSGNFSVFNA